VHQDFMSFLHAQYLADLEEAETKPAGIEKIPSLEGFVLWAQWYLSTQNQPLNVNYLARGIGVRMQQGQILGFSSQDADDGHMEPDYSVPVTGSKMLNSGRLVSSGAIQVTGYAR
jgi:hypothetical protein